MTDYIFQLARGTSAQWAASSRVLRAGEPGLDTDLDLVKYGDGTSLWGALPGSTATTPTVASVYDPSELSAPAGQLLTIPTHVSPLGGEATHPSVVSTPDRFGGYLYWMAFTPYPAAAVAHEDPNIVASQDGITWVVPAGLTNPLDNAAGGTVYNSDTELIRGADGQLWCMWRHVNTATTTETLYVSKSANGVNWSTKTAVLSVNYGALPKLLSPTIERDGDTYLMWVVDMGSGPNRLVRWRSNDITGMSWGTETGGTVSGVVAGKEPWHVEVRRVGGQYVGLLTVCDIGTSGANAGIQVITSTDGLTWQASDALTIPMLSPGYHDRLYRATFLPTYVGGMMKLRTWYSAVLTNPAGTTAWNIFLTDIESWQAGGPVIQLAPGLPIPPGTPGNRTIVSLHTGAAAEVVRNYVTNSSPTTKIDYWTFGYNGPTGVATYTRETTGGPTKGAASWAKKLFTVAAGGTTTYHNFGSSSVETMDCDDSHVWTFSAWLFNSFACDSSVRLLFYNSGGTLIGGAEVLGMYYPHAAGAWERRYYTGTPPVGAVRAAIRGYSQNAIAGIGAVTGMSSLMSTLGTTLYDYHDGAQSPEPGLTPSWVGAAYDTFSILTVNATYQRFWDGAASWPL